MAPARLMSRAARRAIGLMLTAAAALISLGLLPAPMISTLEFALYDARMRAASAQPDPSVVIVDIDESSLGRIGRWPWNRSQIGELAAQLVDQGGAQVVGIDVVFAEPQRERDEDLALSRRLAGRPVILGYYFTAGRGGRSSGALPAPVMSSAALVGLPTRITAWDGYGANLAGLQAQAAGSGFFNPLIDADGAVRALPLLAEYRGAVYEAFSVAILRQWLGSANLELSADQLRLRGQRGAIGLPLSEGLTGLVPFAGRMLGPGGATGAAHMPLRRFESVSAADVIEERIDWSRFRGRVVLIGTSAPGLTDLRATPLSAAFPGVEVHATLIAAAIAATQPATQSARPPGVTTFKSRSPLTATLAAATAVVVGAGLALLLPMLGPGGAVLASAAGGFALWAGAEVAWYALDMVVPLAGAMAMVGLLLLLNLSVGYFIEGRARRAVAALFGEYVSPALVAQMVRNPERFVSSGSENRELTILFVDIRGFTRMSETLDPERLREYINSFLTAMTEIVHRYGGTVDKYIGDAVMAFWGAPLDDPEHADHAVAAAQAMLFEVERLTVRLQARNLPPLRVGIGINTGAVRVGDMGSARRRAYTVIGDAVNLASRFESLTKLHDASIIVGERTVALATGHRFRALGEAQGFSRSEPVMIFAPATE